MSITRENAHLYPQTDGVLRAHSLEEDKYPLTDEQFRRCYPEPKISPECHCVEGQICHKGTGCKNRVADAHRFPYHPPDAVKMHVPHTPPVHVDTSYRPYTPEFAAGEMMVPYKPPEIKPGMAFPALENPVRRYIYVMGALKNPKCQVHAMTLRVAFSKWGVFDDWQAAHHEADDEWRAYELAKGNTYEKALREPAAQNVFMFDKTHLDLSTHGLLVLPAGKSAHLELGYLRGRNCYTAILLDDEYDRWDVMYAFADIVTHDITEIIDEWSVP